MVITKGVMEPKTCSFTWKIRDFFANCPNVGDKHKSPEFPIKCADQTTRWYLTIHPNGIDESSRNYVTISIYFGGSFKVTIDYQISIVSRQIDFSKFSNNETFKPGEGWGWDQFAEHDLLKNTKNGALIDDTLTIVCEITFCKTSQGDKDSFNDNKLFDSVDNVTEDYEKLLEANYFSDVTFDIRGEKMYLHKGILMCRNSVFKAMLEHDMKENKQSTVEITDIDYEVIRELFRFIYSGKVNKIEEIAKDLLIAADKYDATELKALCEKTIYDVLSIDNAIEYLKFTEMCNTIHLKKLVIKFIVDNLKDIVRESNFNLLFAEIDREVVCELMKAIADKK